MLPRICKHKYSARVCLSGVQVYLGPWGSDRVQQRYDEVVGEWLAHGRQVPSIIAGTLTVRRLAERYFDVAQSYYVKRGRPTQSALRARCVLERLVSHCGRTPAGDFGPRLLLDFRRALCATGRLNRTTINEYIAVVQRMYRWAASEELLPPGRWLDVLAVTPLRRGRSPGAGIAAPREPSAVAPVPPDVLAATLPHCHRMLRAMIELQLATAMRPGELLAIRPCDLAPTQHPEVQAYTVRADASKIEHHGLQRVVYIGPRGLSILREWAPAQPDTHYFSPARARAMHNLERRAARKSKVWPSHESAARRARRLAPPPSDGPLYTNDSYRRAIQRACDRAFPHPTLPTRGLTPEHRAELRDWRKSHRWHPNQLRHSAASYLAEHERVEVAQIILGHTSVTTTMRYVQVRDERPVLAALRHG